MAAPTDRQPPDAAPGVEDVVARVAETVRANYLRIGEPDQRLSPDEARRLAAEVVHRLLPADRFPRLLITRGFLFVVEEQGGDGQEDLLHILLWNGDRWVGIDRIPLPAPPVRAPQEGGGD